MPTDLVIINATVRTLNPAQPKAQAIAITQDRIVKVGTNTEISSLIDETTKVLNFEGKTVLPGLIDTHIHVADFGRCLIWLDLSPAKSIGELQNLLKEKANQTIADKWIIGRAWNEMVFKEKRMPTIQDLDAAAPDNPVILYHEAAMICAVNSKALQTAHITNHTPDPKGGVINKDPKTGQLTGILRDAATNLIWQAVPEPTAAELLEMTAAACQKISQAGITSVHWLVLSEVELSIIQNLHLMGRLPFRVNVVVPIELLEKTVRLKIIGDPVLRFGGVTLSVDGYLDSKKAALFEPYSDEPTNRGKLFFTKKELTESVKKVLAARVQPIILAMGDKAVSITLDVIGEIPKSDIRFRIEQAAVLNKSLVTRLSGHGVVVSIQPKVVTSEFSAWSATKHLGLKRARWLHPLKTLLNEGVKIAAGSDCPMEPLNPLLGIKDLMLREAFPEQRLTVEEALRMYTLDAAYSSGEETMKGSIEEGKLADLTVLSADPMVVAPEKVADIPVEMIVINGKIVVF